MDLRTQYSFPGNNFVGTTVNQRLTSVVVEPAADGQPVVKPCLNDSFIPESPHQAIAYRPSAEADWQPVRSIAQFQEIVKGTPADQLGSQLGTWTDKKRFWVVGARDGVPQAKEVKPFSERWQGMQTVLTRPLVDRGFRVENTPEAEVRPFQVGLEAAQVSIDPGSFQVEAGSFPGKEVGFFGETGKVTQHDVYLSKGVGQGHEVISNGGETPLLTGGNSPIGHPCSTPTFVMPKALLADQPSSETFTNFVRIDPTRQP